MQSIMSGAEIYSVTPLLGLTSLEEKEGQEKPEVEGHTEEKSMVPIRNHWRDTHHQPLEQDFQGLPSTASLCTTRACSFAWCLAYSRLW